MEDYLRNVSRALGALVLVLALGCSESSAVDEGGGDGDGDVGGSGGATGDGDGGGDGDTGGDGDVACDTGPCEGQMFGGFTVMPCCIDADTCGYDASALGMGCLDPAQVGGGGGTGVMNDGMGDISCAGVECAEACPGGGCTLECDQGGDCAFDCDDGGCQTTCDEAATCSVDCAGGGCTMECDEAGTVCSVNCGGDTPCEVMCAGGATATCEGNCNLTGC